MNNRIKRILTIAIVLAMCISVLAIQAFAEEGQVAEIQSRIDAVLTQYGITADMTDNEIAAAISAKDGDTIKATMEEIAAIEEAAQSLTEEELSAVDGELYGRFCDVLKRLYIPAQIAQTVNVLDGQVSITDTANKNTLSGGTVTLKATGSLFGKGTNTITITNETANRASLSFQYSASSYNSFTINSVAPSSASGTHTQVLEPGGTVSLYLQSKQGLTGNTATLTLSNFSLTVVSSDAKATITYDSTKGTVSGVTSGNAVTATNGTVAVVATPKSGHTFLGWVNTDTHERMDTSADTMLPVPQNMNIEAVFVNTASDTAWFLVGGKYLYDNLNQAATKAASVSDKTVVLINNGTLPANADNLDTKDVTETEYTIPSGVTLLIPCDNAHTLYTTEAGDAGGDTYTTPTVFRKLTMAANAKIIVNGAISVGGKIGTKMSHVEGENDSTIYTDGAPSGPLGYIAMNSNSNIIVNSGGNLYAWGFITGSGSVTINSGGAVYEDMQIRDWRGGNATTGVLGGKDDYEVFPFSQYYIQNIEVPLTIHSGATQNVCTAISYTSISLSGTYSAVAKVTTTFLGSSAGLIRLSSGSMTRTYVGSTDRIIYELDGNVSFANLNVTMTVALGQTVTINSQDYLMPLNSNMTIVLNSGSNVTMSQDFALLPGSIIHINSGATCTLDSGKRLIVYDADQWGAYTSASNLKLNPAAYVPSRTYTRTEKDLVDAKLIVDGTLDATDGALYTTTSGANITSNGNGIVKTVKGDQTVTYQVTQSGNTVGSWNEISITPAKLRNGTGASKEYEATASYDGTYTYDTATQEWHSFGTGVVTNPTCVDAGYTTHTCAACGDSYRDTPTDALGHDETGAWQSDGTNHYKICQRTGCGEKILTDTHTGGTATCQTQATCSTCKQLYGNLGNHTEVTDAAVAPTYNTVGKTEGKHCSLCNTVTVEQTDVVAATIGDTEYTILSEAIAAAGPSDTIVLQANISGEVPIGKLLTINKNDCTVELKAADGFVITETDKANTVTSLIKIMATNIVVSNGLDMYFYVNADCIPNDSGYTAVVTKHFADNRGDAIGRFTADEWKANGEYVGFGFSDISAKEMTDNIEVTIYDSNGTAVSKTYTQSVQDYVILTLKQGSTNDALRTALIDMLNYGAAAQQFFNYNTGVLANVDPGEETIIADNSDFATVDVTACTNGLEDPPDNFAGVTVSAKNTLMFTFYFYIDDPTGMVATITYTDHNNTPQTETVRAEDFYKRSEGLYGVDVTGLSIIDGRCMMTCTIVDGAGNPVAAVSDSIEGYVARKSNGSNDIFEQMMKFVDSAVNYFDSLKGE